MRLPSPHRIAAGIAAGAVCGSLLSMLAWVMGVSAIESTMPYWETMKFVAAFCFLLCGVMLFAVTRPDGGWRETILPLSSAFLLLLLAALVVTRITGMQTAIREAFLGGSPAPGGGRPSWGIVAAYFFIGCMGLQRGFGRRWPWIGMRSTGIIVMLIGASALLGYLLREPLLFYAFGPLDGGMAPQVGLALLLLGFGFVAAEQPPAFSRRVAAAFLLILCAGIGAMVCIRSMGRSHVPLEELTVAEAGQVSVAPLYVAEEKGFFADEGLHVTYRHFATGNEALAEMLAGGADLSTAYETPVTRSIMSGAALRVLTVLHSADRNAVLIGRTDRGVREPADLRGKRIGVPKGTSLEFFLHQFLTVNGLSVRDVRVVDVSGAQMEAAMRDGRVDAVAIVNPYREAIVRDAGDAAVVFSTDIYAETSMLLGSAATVGARTDAVCRFVAAVVRAQAFLQDPANRDESVEIVQRRMADKGVQSDASAYWDLYRFEPGLSNILVSTMEQEARWMVERGEFSSGEPDFMRVMDARCLDRVQPSSVTVLPPS